MSSGVPVKPALLDWAIQESQIDLAVLLQRYPKLADWLSSLSSPSFNQLKELSAFLKVPFGFMFLSNPPKEPSVIREFRTIGNNKIERMSKDLKDTLLNMKAVSEWMQEVRRLDMNEPSLPFIGAYSQVDDERALVESFLEITKLELGFGTLIRGPEKLLKKLRERFESLGVLVFSSGIVGSNTRRGLSVNEFRAFCIVDEYAPLIFINSKDGKCGQVFSLIHEFLHLLLGENGVTLNNSNETLCNRVAARLLLPDELLIPLLGQGKVDFDRIEWMSQHFNVSRMALATRLIDMHRIPRSLYDIIKNATEADVAQKQGAIRKGSPDFHTVYDANSSLSFRKALATQLYAGNTSYLEAGRLMMVSKPQTISEILARALE